MNDRKNTRAALLLAAAAIAAVLLLGRITAFSNPEKPPGGVLGPDAGTSNAAKQHTLVKHKGHGQFSLVDQRAPSPLAVKVLDGENPVPGITVDFRIVVDPSRGKGTGLSVRKAETDSNGIAETELTLGPEHGSYLVEAGIPGRESNSVIFKVAGKKKNWVFFLVAGLIGGLGLFLFGMNMMGHSLRDWAGDQMKNILGALTKHRVYGLIIGIVTTAIMNSSSATTVMLVGFTNAGLMSLRQAIGVILGADIGSTITAQIVAFKLTDYALLFIGIGFILNISGGKKENLRCLGSVLLGFGLLFYGLKVMGDVMYPLREHPTFINMMAHAENPLIALLVSAAFTSIIQSSGATTALIVALSAQGLVSLQAAIPLIFGANIGTCITAALATLGGTTREAKRVAIAHYSFKIIGVVLFLFIMSQFARFVEAFAVWTTSATWETVTNPAYMGRQVANAHTFFNVFMALLFLPFTRYMEKIIYQILPEEKLPPIKKFGPKYLDKFLLDIPELALKQSKREVLRMGKYVQRMIDNIMNAFRERNTEFIDQAVAVDEKVDIFEVSIKNYFTELAQRKSSSIQSKRRIEMFFIVDELEKIGDVISKNIMPQINQLIEHDLYFSEEGWKELNSFHSLLSENFGRAMEAFRNNDLKTAEEVVRDKQRMLRYYKNLQMGHLERLCRQDEYTSRTSQIHLDILGNMRGVNSHITNIAVNMLEHAREMGDADFATDVEDIEELEDGYETSILKSLHESDKQDPPSS